MERASVRVVSEPPEPEAGPPQAAVEPEAGPPQNVAPPQELEPDIGGPVQPSPTPDQIIGAEGGSLAERVRARHEGIASTEEFAVPGWELDDGSPGLILVARTFGDRKAYNSGISNEAFIARSTHKLLFVNNDGSREEIPGGWGPGLAQIMGVSITRAADLVALVISKPDPDNPDSRIPNVAGIGVLATMIINWAGRGNREAEEELGG